MVRASVVWLNYNSMRFIDIALRSLESFLSLDFDDYELIVVDNASSDGSFEVIKKCVEEHGRNVKVKIVRNDKNLGYAGGMNVGWEARDPESRYVAFVNNDLIATPESLTKLIEHIEGDEKIGAVSGLIYYPDEKTIYSVGGWVDELWSAGSICNGFTINECPDIDKGHYVTYADGAYMVVRTEVIKKVMPSGKPFIDEAFLYLDDNLLGLILWNKGYRVRYVPVNTGIHYVGRTTSGFYSNFYLTRGLTALSYVVRTRYSGTIIGLARDLRRYVNIFIDKTRYQGFVDGKRLGKALLMRIGALNLYCAPYVEVTLSKAINKLFSIRYYKSKNYIVRPSHLKMKNSYIEKCTSQ